MAGEATNRGTANIAVAGHVDHGKSTVTSAMTALLAAGGLASAKSVEAPNDLRAVREWGMSFRRSVTEFRTTRRSYRQIDCPGQMDFVKSIVGGSMRPDAALLVVSAADGPMSHTRSQLTLLRLLDIPIAAVLLNKVDSVSDTELVGRVEEEVREMLTACGYTGAAIPFVRGSALLALRDLSNREAVGPFEQLFDVLDEMVPAPAADESEAPFLLPSASVYHDDHRGMVVKGTVERGSVAVGDAVIHLGANGVTNLEVRGIEKGRKGVDRAGAGELVEIAFGGDARETVHRGSVIAAPGSIASVRSFRAVAYLLSAQEGGRKGETPGEWSPHFLMRAAEVEGTVALPAGRETLRPGELSEMDIKLGAQVALEKRQRFGIKETGRTVGAGVVTEIAQ